MINNIFKRIGTAMGIARTESIYRYDIGTYLETQKEDNIEIKQVGFTYVFKLSGMLLEEDKKRIEDNIVHGLNQGCVFLTPGVELIDVKPQYKAMVKTW